MTTEISPGKLSDAELVAHLVTVAGDARRATAALVAALAEFDARRLYLGQGCASLFAYCTNVLHLSESATFNRTEAARAAAKYPAVLDGLRDGTLTLTAVRLLAPVLTPANCDALLRSAVHKPKRDIEKLVATVRPVGDVPTVVRKLPTRGPAPMNCAGLPVTTSTQTQTPPTKNTIATPMLAALPGDRSAPASQPVMAPAKTARITPLSVDRYKIQFTASQAMHDKLRRAQDLMRHCVPSGDTAQILERALDLLIAQIEKRKFAAVERPRAPRASKGRSRRIPAQVRREVSRRDEERCAFTGPAGRCQERGFLEFHHVDPYADGGPATADNIQLRCNAHNRYDAELVFGLERVGDVDDELSLFGGDDQSV